MNWIDYTILAVLGFSVLVGLWRGLVSEVLALVIWVAAFWVAWLLGPTVAARLTAITLPALRVAAGYAACFVLVLVLGAILRYVVRRLLEGSGLSGTDRLLGMLFGFVRGALLVCVLVFLCQFTSLTREPLWQQSVLLPPFQSATIWLGQQVPPDLRAHFQPAAAADALREHLNPAAVSSAVRGQLDSPVVTGALHAALSPTAPSDAPHRPSRGGAPAPAATAPSPNHP
jgi:membrane protein required for colicin V production